METAGSNSRGKPAVFQSETSEGHLGGSFWVGGRRVALLGLGSAVSGYPGVLECPIGPRPGISCLAFWACMAGLALPASRQHFPSSLVMG